MDRLEREPESDLSNPLLRLLEVAGVHRRTQEVRIRRLARDRPEILPADETARILGVEQVEDLADRVDASGRSA